LDSHGPEIHKFNPGQITVNNGERKQIYHGVVDDGMIQPMPTAIRHSPPMRERCDA
jgi:hypothetical protein